MLTQSPPWWMVVLLGMGIVFVGLSLLVLLCNLLRVAFSRFKDKKPEAQPAVIPAQPAIADRKKLLAIVSAAIAEAEGNDAPGFKIVSFERRS